MKKLLTYQSATHEFHGQPLGEFEFAQIIAQVLYKHKSHDKNDFAYDNA
jgi:hypothetical protein